MTKIGCGWLYGGELWFRVFSFASTYSHEKGWACVSVGPLVSTTAVSTWLVSATPFVWGTGSSDMLILIEPTD
jgi:hypothetical protein